VSSSIGNPFSRPTYSGANWTSIASLPARYVWKVAVGASPNVVYAATTIGLFGSSDGGSSWTRLTFDSTRAVAIDRKDGTDKTILVGVPGAGILRSTDGGVTLVDVSQGLDSTDVRGIVFDAIGNAYASLFGNTAGGTWGGVFKLPAGTATWMSWNTAGGGTAIASKFVTSLAVSATTLLAGSLDPNSGDGRVHRSLLAGGGWTNPTTEAAGYLFGVESLNFAGTTFYAGSRALCLYSSTDGGVTWTRQAQAGGQIRDVDEP